MTGVSGNSQQFNDPSFLSNQQQQKIDDQKTVTTGPGGSVGAPVISFGDMITRFIGPSNQGMPGSSRDLALTTNVNADIPGLTLPDTAPLSINIGMFMQAMRSMVPQNDTPASTDTFGFDADWGGAAIATPGLAMPTDLASTDKSTVLNALLVFTGIPTDTRLVPEQKAAFTNILEDMAQKIATKNASGPVPELASGNADQVTSYLTGLISAKGLSADDLTILQLSLSSAASSITANSYTTDLQSTDQKAILSTLMSFTGVDKDPSLTDAQRTTFTAKLNELATNIAVQNSTAKPDPALSSMDDKAVGAYLLAKVDVSTMAPTDKAAFTATINEAASEISSINAASLKQPEKTPLMTGMQSKEPATVLDSMKTMLTAQNMTAAQITELTPKLTDLANLIAQKNGSPEGSGLDITDADTLKASFAALLGSNNDIANADLQTAIGALATAFAAENTSYYSMLAKSTDQTVVFDALRHLSNIDHNPSLSPQERQAGLAYLSLMATALAFMSTVRAKISMLEADIRKNESAGKLATIKDQSNAAAQTFKNAVEKIGKDLQKTLDGIAMKALMAWLGPFIVIILAIIAVICLLIPGVGPEVSAMVLAIMIAVIVVVAVVVVVDMCTDFIATISKLVSKDKTQQDAFKFGFQALLLVIIAVVTFGAAGALIGAVNGARAALAEVLKSVTKEVLKKLIQFMILETLSVFMSSGLLTDLLVKMFKACGMSEKDSEVAAMVATIVATAVIMVATMAGGGLVKGIGKLMGKGADAAEESTKLAAKTVTVELQNVKKVRFSDEIKKGVGIAEDVASPAASIGAKAAKSATEDVLTNIIKQLQKKLSTLTEIAKDPNAMLQFMQALAALAQIGAGFANAVSSFKQADLARDQAKLTLLTSEAQALIDILKQLAPTFDMTQQDLDNSAKDFIKGYTDLMNLFASMVSSASAIVSQTTQTA